MSRAAPLLIAVSALSFSVSACETLSPTQAEPESSSREKTSPIVVARQPTKSRPRPVPPPPRAIELRLPDGSTVTLTQEGDIELSSWTCSAPFGDGETLVEVGFFSAPDNSSRPSGFVLYDGTDSGEATYYRRKGVNQRWDWGEEGEFAFTISPSGGGAFYDFSHLEEGETTGPSSGYNCKKRP